MAGSPYGMPNVGGHQLDAWRDRRTGNTDQYGQRHAQTNALADTNIQQLMRGIDREGQLTFRRINCLRFEKQSMEAMGLGRSGAGSGCDARLDTLHHG